MPGDSVSGLRSRLEPEPTSRRLGSSARLSAVSSARALACAVVTVLAASCARAPQAPGPRVSPTRPAPPLAVDLVLAGELIVPTGTRFAALGSAELGGLSGCAYDAGRDVVLAVSDDRDRPGLFTLKVHANARSAPELGVEPLSVTHVETAHERSDVPLVLDFEGIALVDDEVLLSSEGEDADTEGQQPALLRFDRDGRYLGALPLPPLFLGAPRGQPLRGMRDNQAFESLTSTRDGARVFTGAEGPLRQDDEEADFQRGARTRLLELVKDGSAWRAARQFVYELDPVARPPWDGASSLSSGLVDLLALGGNRLLAMERSFVRERDGARRGENGIRIFEVDASGADDVSGVTSLRERPAIRPVGKRLVLDLESLRPRLGPALRTLENFEAMCEGPPMADGSRSLLLISDNNFSRNQSTAFLLFRMAIR